ncbi:MAG: RING finger protein [Promethearchaeota archaeon]
MGVDFITILLTNKNVDNSYGLAGISNFMWMPIVAILFNYIGMELLIPEKLTLKKIILFSLVIIGIIYEIFLFLDPMSNFNFVYPETSGENLIDGPINMNSPIGIINSFYLITGLFVLGGGFLFKSLQTKGVVRKKFIYLSVGWLIIIVFGFIEIFIYFGYYEVFLTLIRLGIILSFSLWYIGIREEPVEPIKERPKKEVKVEESLFRLTQKPDHITEEEVTFHKEKKICLVCKGKLEDFVFICSHCDVLYCEKCARTLSNLENACWVCNTPIDKSKPIKPYKKREDVEDIPISEEIPKK